MIWYRESIPWKKQLSFWHWPKVRGIYSRWRKGHMINNQGNKNRDIEWIMSCRLPAEWRECAGQGRDEEGMKGKYLCSFTSSSLNKSGSTCRPALYSIALLSTTQHSNAHPITAHHYTAMNSTEEYYTSLHRNAQHFTALLNTAQHCTALYSTTQPCTALHSGIQHYTALYSNAQHCTSHHCTVQ